jgi:ABC-type antimicrobial peptide transport system permease subunit
MLLAVVGIYGVITYTFARRKQELAIRMALGANARSIAGLVLREGFKLTVAGLVLGVLGALALGRLLSGLLYGVSPQDPWVFSLALVVLLGAAFFATSLSARRAARVDALEPLRQGDAAH